MKLPDRLIGIFVFGFISVLFFFGMKGCDSQESLYTGSGVIEAREVKISFELPGELTSLDVGEGDLVKSGDAIARIDTEKLFLEKAILAATAEEITAAEIQAQAGIAHAKAVLEGATKNYQRAVTLKKKEAISPQNFDEIETAYSLAQRSLETAKSSLVGINARRTMLEKRTDALDYQIRKSTLLSPLSGTVLDLYFEQGERIMPTMPVLAIGDLERVWVKIYISQPDIGRVKIGADALVLTDSHPGQSFSGKVVWISDKAEFTPKNVQTRDARADLVYAVKIDIPNSDGVFKIGMPVDCVIEGFEEYLKFKNRATR